MHEIAKQPWAFEQFARRTVLGERHDIVSLPGFWFKPQKFSITAEDLLTEELLKLTGKFPPSVVSKLRRFRRELSGNEDEKDMERKLEDELNDEEVMAIVQMNQQRASPKLQWLRLKYGIGEHNFAQQDSSSVEVPDDFIDTLVLYKPVAMEMLVKIMELNPLFLNGKLENFVSSPNGRSAVAASQTTPSGQEASDPQS